MFRLGFASAILLDLALPEAQPICDFAARLHQIHSKDVRLIRRARDEEGTLAFPPRYHTPKLPGLGDVRWGAFYGALTDTGYAGAVCVEVEDRAYEGSLAGRQRALRQSCRYLRQFIGEGTTKQ